MWLIDRYINASLVDQCIVPSKSIAICGILATSTYRCFSDIVNKSGYD